MLGLLSLFRRQPTAIEAIAAMRDRCIVAETKAVLLENEVERLRRRQLRERRKDARDVAKAIAARAADYADRFAGLTDEQRSKAKAAAARKGRG